VTRAEPRSPLDRFPGFDTLAQSKHWDQVTAGVVLSRIGMAPDIRFFAPTEQAVATALCDQLLGQHGGVKVPVVNLIDARLAEQETDGWRYLDMPEDSQAWRDTLAALDTDATDRFATGFASCSSDQQSTLIQTVQDLGSDPWHGLCAEHVWSLWTRYACTAFYSHAWAWNEIGFSGTAYPRGYKNPGLDSLEPYEVRDAEPGDDPARRQS
jgi:Gluconate 2-dehydrogenase subunit 3